MSEAAVPAAGPPRELPRVAEGVSLWWCGLESAEADVAGLASTLSPAEHARAARFGTDALRRRWIAGRASLRAVLGRTLGLPPAAVPIVRGARGRPELEANGAGIDFNVSHTGMVALVGVLETRGRDVRIGVDVERADRDVAADRLARRVLAPEERAAIAELAPDERRRRFLRYWTCKEAMSKATGDGLIAPFRAIRVELDAGPRIVAGPGRYDPRGWALHAAPVPRDHFATVALWDRSALSSNAPG